jgi:hypothetical protein
VQQQLAEARQQRGEVDLQAMLDGNETWTVA